MMVELPESPLPPEPEYWDRLARRIAADAREPLRALPAADVWYAAVARRAVWLVAASVVLIAALWMALPAVEPEPDYRWVEAAIAPEEAAGSLVAGPVPPRVEELMPHFAPIGEREAQR